MRRRNACFDTLVARYYTAVYTLASRLTDDPREAVLLTHEAFTTTRKQLRSCRNEVELVTILLNALICGGFLAARIEPQITAVWLSDYQRERNSD
jgi:plasmid replication initiation protein